MILECNGCRKMYRVRDDGAAPSQKCPACGGELRTSASSTASLPSPGRVKDLEDRVRQLERELQEARNSTSPSLSQAGGFGFSDPDAQRRAESLDRQLLDLKSETDRTVAEKDRELAAARETADRAEAGRRGLEARVGGLEQTHAKALEEKQKTLDALDASLASYREKLDAAQKKVGELESSSTTEKGELETRLREREEALRSDMDHATEEHQGALAELRAELERQIEEKDRQISEGREVLDREAGERRRLSETVTRLQESLDRTVAEKDQALLSLKASVASHKSKAESLQKRLDDVEELRKADQESYSTKIRAREGVQARVAEAGHLASDLDQSLESVADLLKGLRDRVKRLKGNLAETPVAPTARIVEPTLSIDSRIPAPEADLPAPEPELSVEATPAELAPEAPVEVIEAELLEEAAPEEAVLESPDTSGRMEEPSSVDIPAVTAEDLPLISPPEDDAAPEPPKPPTTEGRRVSRFSWKKR